MEKSKSQLRRLARQNRDQLPAEFRSEASRRMLAVLKNLPGYSQVKRIFLFSSMGSEPETGQWAEKFREDGKEIFYPRTGGNGQMEFYRVRNSAELGEGRYGILEPDGSSESAAPGGGDWVLTPGLLFDQRGYRLGYGGGFYDRYMRKHPEGVYIGTAFAAQVQKTLLPVQSYDLPVQYIVTEQGCRPCGKENA